MPTTKVATKPATKSAPRKRATKVTPTTEAPQGAKTSPPEELTTGAASGSTDVSNLSVSEAWEAADRAVKAETAEGAHIPTVAILGALDSAYAAIRRTHSDVPGSVAITLASGRGKSHGHFQGNAWRDTTAAGDVHAARHELNMATESFRRGGLATFTTLLHEAVHAYAHATNVKDTSRQGRYHGSKFRDIAESFGLVCENDEKIGTRTVGLTTYATEHYSAQISALDAALTTFRAPEASKEAKPKTTVKVECGCGIPVSLPKKFWENMGPVLSCDLCREEDGEGRFQEVAE